MLQIACLLPCYALSSNAKINRDLSFVDSQACAHIAYEIKEEVGATPVTVRSADSVVGAYALSVENVSHCSIAGNSSSSCLDRWVDL